MAMLVTNSLTHSLTNSCLVNLIDMTLECKDAKSKLVEVITVADVDDEDRVGNSLLQIWKLRFGHKVRLLFRFRAQSLVKILKLSFRQDLKLEFGQYFVADVDDEDRIGNSLLQIWKLRFGYKVKLLFRL